MNDPTEPPEDIPPSSNIGTNPQEEFFDYCHANTEPHQPWYKSEAVQILYSALFFAGMTAILMGLFTMFSERLTAYMNSRTMFIVNITSGILLNTANHVRIESQYLTTDEINVALELSKNLEMAAKDLNQTTDFLLKSQESSSPMWLQFAIGEYSLQNKLNVKHSARVLHYVSSIDPRTSKLPPEEKLDWSSHFVNWAVEKAGLVGTDNSQPESWLNWGKAITEPKPGAIAILAMNPPQNVKTVGFVLAETPSYIIVLAGDVVRNIDIIAFDKSNILGYRWPIE